MKLRILKAHDTRTKTKMEVARDFQIGLRTLYKILNQRAKLEEIVRLSGKGNIKPRCRKQIVPRSRLTARLKAGMHSGLGHYEQFACSYCNQKFTNATNRRRHIKHIHMMEPQLRIHACPICPRAYNRKDNLLFHLRQCHELVPSMLINQESVEAIQVFT